MISSAELEKLFRKYGLAEQFREQEPALLWKHIVGPWVARLTEPIWVHDGVLFVAVPSHAAQHEFNLMREEFKRKLNQGAERVREIRFRVENFPRPSPSLSLAQIQLTPEEEKEIEQVVSLVEESDLREALERLMKTAKKLERARQKLGWKPCSKCGLLCEGNFCPLCAEEVL